MVVLNGVMAVLSVSLLKQSKKVYSRRYISKEELPLVLALLHLLAIDPLLVEGLICVRISLPLLPNVDLIVFLHR